MREVKNTKFRKVSKKAGKYEVTILIDKYAGNAFDEDCNIFVPAIQVKGMLKEVVEAVYKPAVRRVFFEQINGLIITPCPILLVTNAAKHGRNKTSQEQRSYTDLLVFRNIEINFTITTADFSAKDLFKLFLKAQEVVGIGKLRRLGYGAFSLKRFWRVSAENEETRVLIHKTEQNITPIARDSDSRIAIVVSQRGTGSNRSCASNFLKIE